MKNAISLKLKWLLCDDEHSCQARINHSSIIHILGEAATNPAFLTGFRNRTDTDMIHKGFNSSLHASIRGTLIMSKEESFSTRYTQYEPCCSYHRHITIASTEPCCSALSLRSNASNYKFHESCYSCEIHLRTVQAKSIFIRLAKLTEGRPRYFYAPNLIVSLIVIMHEAKSSSGMNTSSGNLNRFLHTDRVRHCSRINRKRFHLDGYASTIPSSMSTSNIMTSSKRQANFSSVKTGQKMEPLTAFHLHSPRKRGYIKESITWEKLAAHFAKYKLEIKFYIHTISNWSLSCKFNSSVLYVAHQNKLIFVDKTFNMNNLSDSGKSIGSINLDTIEEHLNESMASLTGDDSAKGGNSSSDDEISPINPDRKRRRTSDSLLEIRNNKHRSDSTPPSPSVNTTTENATDFNITGNSINSDSSIISEINNLIQKNLAANNSPYDKEALTDQLHLLCDQRVNRRNLTQSAGLFLPSNIQEVEGGIIQLGQESTGDHLLGEKFINELSELQSNSVGSPNKVNFSVADLLRFFEARVTHTSTLDIQQSIANINSQLSDTKMSFTAEVEKALQVMKLGLDEIKSNIEVTVKGLVRDELVHHAAIATGGKTPDFVDRTLHSEEEEPFNPLPWNVVGSKKKNINDERSRPTQSTSKYQGNPRNNRSASAGSRDGSNFDADFSDFKSNMKANYIIVTESYNSPNGDVIGEKLRNKILNYLKLSIGSSVSDDGIDLSSELLDTMSKHGAILLQLNTEKGSGIVLRLTNIFNSTNWDELGLPELSFDSIDKIILKDCLRASTTCKNVFFEDICKTAVNQIRGVNVTTWKPLKHKSFTTKNGTKVLVWYFTADKATTSAISSRGQMARIFVPPFSSVVRLSINYFGNDNGKVSSSSCDICSKNLRFQISQRARNWQATPEVTFKEATQVEEKHYPTSKIRWNKLHEMPLNEHPSILSKTLAKLMRITNLLIGLDYLQLHTKVLEYLSAAKVNCLNIVKTKFDPLDPHLNFCKAACTATSLTSFPLSNYKISHDSISKCVINILSYWLVYFWVHANLDLDITNPTSSFCSYNLKKVSSFQSRNYISTSSYRYSQRSLTHAEKVNLHILLLSQYGKVLNACQTPSQNIKIEKIFVHVELYSYIMSDEISINDDEILRSTSEDESSKKPTSVKTQQRCKSTTQGKKTKQGEKFIIDNLSQRNLKLQSQAKEKAPKPSQHKNVAFRSSQPNLDTVVNSTLVDKPVNRAASSGSYRNALLQPRKHVRATDCSVSSTVPKNPWFGSQDKYHQHQVKHNTNGDHRYNGKYKIAPRTRRDNSHMKDDPEPYRTVYFAPPTYPKLNIANKNIALVAYKVILDTVKESTTFTESAFPSNAADMRQFGLTSLPDSSGSHLLKRIFPYFKEMKYINGLIRTSFSPKPDKFALRRELNFFMLALREAKWDIDHRIRSHVLSVYEKDQINPRTEAELSIPGYNNDFEDVLNILGGQIMMEHHATIRTGDWDFMEKYDMSGPNGYFTMFRILIDSNTAGKLSVLGGSIRFKYVSFSDKASLKILGKVKLLTVDLNSLSVIPQIHASHHKRLRRRRLLDSKKLLISSTPPITDLWAIDSVASFTVANLSFLKQIVSQSDHTNHEFPIINQCRLVSATTFRNKIYEILLVFYWKFARIFYSSNKSNDKHLNCLDYSASFNPQCKPRHLHTRYYKSRHKNRPA